MRLLCSGRKAGGRGKITPECIAINLNHSESVDNAGEQRINARAMGNVAKYAAGASG